MDQNMIIDVDGAYQHYCKEHGSISKTAFLSKIGMSTQTASNYETGKSKQKVLQYAQKIKEVTGLSFDQIIKKPKN